MKYLKPLFFWIVICLLAAPLWGQNCEDSLTIALTKLYEASNLPGFAVAIVSENEVLYQYGFGYANIKSKKPFTPETIQHIGSVSKTVVGVAVVKAIEEGKLSMDTEINTLLPFRVQNPFHRETPITIRHLVNHTSSILDTKHYGKTYVLADPNQKIKAGEHPGYFQFIQGHERMDLKTFLPQILSKEGKWYKKKNFLKSPPGAVKEYSNLNAALAAYLVELATGIPFDEYTKTNILAPLNMSASTWNLSQVEVNQLANGYFPAGPTVPKYNLITYPDGGLLSSVGDMTNYLMEIIKGYNGTSDFLDKVSFNLLLPGDHDTERAFWGMGEKSRNIGHSGSDPGAQTDLQFNADSKIGRIIFSNVNAEDNEVLWEQYRQIHSILKKYEPKLILLADR